MAWRGLGCSTRRGFEPLRGDLGLDRLLLLAAHAVDMRLRYAGVVEASRRQLSEAEPPAATLPRNASSLGAACPSGYAIRGACVPVGTSPLQYYVDLVSALHLPASPSV